jgi:short-subunit dehydrogenase
MSTNVAKTAFITGATTGIGYELSKLFAEDQYNLVLVARNEAKIWGVSDCYSERFKQTGSSAGNL